MDPVASLLRDLGINIAASAMYDFFRTRFLSGGQNRQALETDLNSFLSLNGVHVSAATVIDAFAAKGLLEVRGTTLYAPQSITMGAAAGATFAFGFDSVSRTDSTAIHAQGDAVMHGTNAEVRQNPDGSVSFHVGGDGHVAISMPKPRK
jgi:hypothetical protein